ncbi:MAG: hypothetical protein ACI9AH_001395 [Oceanospirillaceae bacterium]|jgi:hypothetical protein
MCCAVLVTKIASVRVSLGIYFYHVNQKISYILENLLKNEVCVIIMVTLLLNENVQSENEFD